MKGRALVSIIYILLIFTLLVIGISMMYSASFTEGLRRYNSFYYFIIRQVVWVLLGIVIFVITSRINYQSYKKYRGFFMILGVVILVMVFIFGKEVNGSKRWLSVGGIISVQPSEFAKLLFIIYFAATLDYYRQKKYRSLDIVMYSAIPLFVFLALIFFEKDFSTAAHLFIIAFLMMFVSEASIFHLGLFFISTMGLGIMAVSVSEVRRRRVIEFLAGMKEGTTSVGYQAKQALIALGNGRGFGVGYGNGLQKYYYLPERHTDYIFATYGEEFGFLGNVILIGIYFALSIILILSINRVKNYFGKYLLFGIFIFFITQTLINLYVVTRLVPSTGIPLPLISYGGSSLMVSMISLGIALNIINNTENYEEE